MEQNVIKYKNFCKVVFIVYLIIGIMGIVGAFTSLIAEWTNLLTSFNNTVADLYIIVLFFSIYSFAISLVFIIGAFQIKKALDYDEQTLLKNSNKILIWSCVLGALTFPWGIATIVFAVIYGNNLTNGQDKKDL